jgi:hypothetical protein
VLEASKRGDAAGIQDEEGMEEDVEWPEEIDDVPDYKM